jgi:hypothetical protein
MCPSSRPLRAGGRRALGGVLEQDDVQMGAAAGHVGCAEKRLHAGEVAVPQVEAGRGGVGRWAVVGGVHAKRPEVGDGDKSRHERRCSTAAPRSTPRLAARKLLRRRYMVQRRRGDQCTGREPKPCALNYYGRQIRANLDSRKLTHPRFRSETPGK